MKITPLIIPDVLLIESNLSQDSRGFFYETYREDILRKKTLSDISFVQENYSNSSQGVLRGLHYQLPPFAQGKLVRVLRGEVFDVAVDIRKSSPTFGKWVGELLTAENRKQIWIPEGFAHGFLTLSTEADFLYKVTDYYHPNEERCIIWSDISLNIKWPRNSDIMLSYRDSVGLSLENSDVFD
jgi:dTDP-4-dehydrorhamnose 3,5-epimerase